MIVQAALGTRVPKEGKPRDYITDQEPVTVPGTSYYRRLVLEGSLVEPPPAKKQTKTATQEAQ